MKKLVVGGGLSAVLPASVIVREAQCSLRGLELIGQELQWKKAVD